MRKGSPNAARRRPSRVKRIVLPIHEENVKHYVAGNICLVTIDGQIITCFPARWVR